MFAPPLKIELLFTPGCLSALGVPHPNTIRRALHTYPGKRHPQPQERP